jgi:hypothetical protein
MFGNASPGISTRAITPQTIGLAGLAQHHQGIADAHVAGVEHLTHWRRIALVTDIDFPAAELGCGS